MNLPKLKEEQMVMVVQENKNYINNVSEIYKEKLIESQYLAKKIDNILLKRYSIHKSHAINIFFNKLDEAKFWIEKDIEYYKTLLK